MCTIREHWSSTPIQSDSFISYLWLRKHNSLSCHSLLQSYGKNQNREKAINLKSNLIHKISNNFQFYNTNIIFFSCSMLSPPIWFHLMSLSPLFLFLLPFFLQSLPVYIYLFAVVVVSQFIRAAYGWKHISHVCGLQNQSDLFMLFNHQAMRIFYLWPDQKYVILQNKIKSLRNTRGYRI